MIGRGDYPKSPVLIVPAGKPQKENPSEPNHWLQGVSKVTVL
jgi:hypothetical protein